MLGSNLVRELLDNGHDLRILVQADRKTNTLEGLKLEKVVGDLLDYDSLKSAAGHVDAIFHLAASTSLWPSKCKTVRRVNIEGTNNILRLAEELKVKKLIYVGTANTFSFGSKESPGVENTSYTGRKYGLSYMDSKWEAHQLVLEAVQKGVPAVIVNPTFMIGAYDSVPNSGAMIIAIYEQKLPGYAPGGRNYICAKDAAVGISNALEKGKVGDSYIIGNENLTYREAFGKIASELNLKPPKQKLPKLGILAYGRFGSLVGNITNKKPVISYPMAKIACDGHYFSSEKAVRELNLPQTPIEEGIQESFNWLKSNGYITK